MKPKILATSWHPGGMNAIIPVIKKLSQDGYVDVVTIGHGYSEGILESSGIEYKKISDYGLENVSLESMKRVLDKESPSLILTGTSTPDENNQYVIEQTTTLAGRDRSIPTLSVLDFWGEYSARFNGIHPDEHFKFLPDKIAIMDQYAERDMLREGFDKDKLIITGNPHFDNLEAKAREYSANQKNSVKEKINMNTKRLFFYAASNYKRDQPKFGYWDLDNIKIIDGVLNEISGKDKGKYGVVIKLHPRIPQDDLNEISDYIARSQNIKIVKDIHPHELILATDLTLTSGSTLGFEAVYMKKPCISIQPNLCGPNYLTVLSENNIIPIGYNAEECRSLIKRAFVDDNYREKELSLQAANFRTDGKATERVTNLAYELLKKTS